MVTLASGCGETYVDNEATGGSTVTVPSTTLAPVPADASAQELMEMLRDELEGLSAEIIAEDNPEQILRQAQATWEILEPKLADQPNVQGNVKSVMDFADMAVANKRAADADKAVKLLDDEIEALS